MIRIFSTPVTAIAHILRDALAVDGIDAKVRDGNMHLAGGLPLDACLAEVWVRPEDEARAMTTLGRLVPTHAAGGLSLASDGAEGGEVSLVEPEWACPSCGAKVPQDFDVCWSCQTERSA